MKKKIYLLLATVLIASSFAGCTSKEVSSGQTNGTETTTENVTTEAATENVTEDVTEEITEEVSEEITEEVTTEVPEEPSSEPDVLVEYTTDESNIPTELMDALRSSNDADFQSYLYGDIDRDGGKELLAAYLDYSVGQWKIVKLENDALEAEDFYSISIFGDYERCQMELLDVGTATHIVANLNSVMGTGCDSHVLDFDGSQATEILNASATIYQDPNGDILVQKTSYSSSLDTTTGMMAGRTWTYSYLTYDAESQKYQEYIANEITEDEFLGYEGSHELVDTIKSNYEDMELKLTFYKRSNGLLHLQYEYLDGTSIMYNYYTLSYEDTVITGTSEAYAGIIEKNFTTLDGI